MTEARAIAADPSAPPLDRLTAARDLISLGEGVEVLDLVRDLAPRHAAELRKLGLFVDYVQRVTKGLGFAGDQRWQTLDGRAPGTASESTGVLLWAHPGARRTVLAFSNLVGGFGALSGWHSVALVQRALAPLAANVVYLLDRSRCLHFAGIHGLAGDYPGCIDALKKLLEQRDWTETYAFGGSAGGYAALRYGLDLEVRAVLSLSGPTNLDPATLPANEISNWDVLYRTAPAYAVDLLPLYRARARRPRLLLCHGTLNKPDTRNAQRMAELPETELIPFEGLSAHSTFHEAVRTKRLGELSARLVGA